MSASKPTLAVWKFASCDGCHCQLGPTLICRDGPVYPWAEVAPLLAVREL